MANVNTFMRLLKMFPHPIEAADEHTAVTLTSLKNQISEELPPFLSLLLRQSSVILLFFLVLLSLGSDFRTMWER